LSVNNKCVPKILGGVFIKRFVCTALAVIMTALVLLPASGAQAAEISAECAIVYEPNTQTVLFEKDADKHMLIASTTKIMTALIVLENCDLDEPVTITKDHVGIEGSSMYLREENEYTVRDLLYGLMIVSGNDAATALADHTAGSMENFACLMNQRAELMGLENTSFANSHGLDAEDHYSCARDMAKLAAEALKNEQFRELFACESYQCGEMVYHNDNKFLNNYEGCIGCKTGYTKAAGKTLVSAAQRDGMTLICVTLSAPQHREDHIKLYDEAFAQYCYIPCLNEASHKIPVISGTSEYVKLRADTDGFVLPKVKQFQAKVYLPSFVFASVVRGDRAGTVMLCSSDGEQITVPIYYDDTVLTDESNRLTPWERFKRAWQFSHRVGIYYPAH